MRGCDYNLIMEVGYVERQPSWTIAGEEGWHFKYGYEAACCPLVLCDASGKLFRKAQMTS